MINVNWNCLFRVCCDINSQQL